MAQLPDKYELMLTLLESGSVYLHLDPRREGVNVPEWFKEKSQLVLQIGLNFPIPIRDLEIDERGVRCTLSFNRQPFYCIVPWSSVYALIAEDGQATVWPTEIPTELAPLAEAGATPQAVRARKPRDKSAPKKPRIVSVARKDDGSESSAHTEPKPVDQQPLALAASESASSESNSGETHTPRFTRSGREVPSWLRVVK
jgi:stringent starvation protein B